MHMQLLTFDVHLGSSSLAQVRAHQSRLKFPRLLGKQLQAVAATVASF